MSSSAQTLIALNLAMVATALLHPATQGRFLLFGGLMTLVAVVVVAGTTTAPPSPPTQGKDAKAAPPVGLVVGAVGALLLLVLTLYALTDANWLSMHLQHLILWVAVVLIALGLGRQLPSRPPRRMLLWGLVLLVVGLLPRALFIEDMRVFLDETIYAVEAWRGASRIPLLSQVTRQIAAPHLFTYWDYLATQGIGPSLVALRLPSVVLGTLTVLAVWALAREVFCEDEHGERLAWLAALLFATFPLHLFYSRIGLHNIGDVLFGTLAAALLLRSRRTGDRMTFVLAGCMLGLSTYFYSGGRFFYPVMLGTWALWALRGQRRGLGLALLAAVVIAAPVFVTGYAQWGTLSVRYTLFADNDQTVSLSLTGGVSLLQRTATHAAMLTTTSDTQIVNYGGVHGVVPPLLVFFLIVGAGQVLRRGRTHIGALLLWWCVGLLLALAIVTPEPVSGRLLPMSPVLVILITFGVRTTVGALPLNPRRHLTTVILVVVAAYQLVYLFGYHYPLWDRMRWDGLAAAGSHDLDDAVLRAADLPGLTHVHLLVLRPPGYARVEFQLMYLIPGVEVTYWREDTLDDLEQELRTDGVHAVFFPADVLPLSGRLTARGLPHRLCSGEPSAVPALLRLQLLVVGGDCQQKHHPQL